MTIELPKRSITKENPYKIVFVCLGNICRSPTAEGIFQYEVNGRGLQSYFEIDSAGTAGYHIGEKADPRSRETALKHGVSLLSKSRKFVAFDVDYYDLIIPMDQNNLRDIHSLVSDPQALLKIVLLRNFDLEANADSLDVPDPYYGGESGFENVFQMIKRSCSKLLDKLETQIDY